jgi:hypothetical protein
MESVIKGLHFILTLCIVVLQSIRRRLWDLGVDPATLSLRHLYIQARSLGDDYGPTQKELKRIRKKILAALAAGQRSAECELTLDMRVALGQACFRVRPGAEEKDTCIVSW